MPSLLPEFAHPPLHEVALSLQFDDLNLSLAHLAVVWSVFQDRFVDVEVKPQLAQIDEDFGVPRPVPPIKIELVTQAPGSLWYQNAEGTELLHLQSNRFGRNWRKTQEQPEYPRYTMLRRLFEKDLDRFVKFIEDRYRLSLGVNWCEVAYVNFIEVEQLGQLSTILSCISTKSSDDFLGIPESAELSLRYMMKDERGIPCGNLYIEARPVVRESDNQFAIRLALTARVQPDKPDVTAALQAFDRGHDAIVRGFASITTPEKHAIWGRRQ